VAGSVGFVEVPVRYELAATLGPLQLGRGDPCTRVGPFVAGRATRTPQGPATAWYTHRPDDGIVQVDAWGEGAGWLVDHAPGLLGADDDLDGFADLVAGHPLLHRLHRAHPGLRIGRSLAVFEALVVTICGQKVTGLEAKRAWRGIVARWGGPAPGPGGLQLPPDPARLATAAYHELHRFGVERRRAETILAVAKDAARLDRLVDLTPAEAVARMGAVAGIGAWSTAEVARLALGDADAVSYGDYHLPHIAAWAMLGRRRGTDELLAELVAPYAPHRGRVVRLLERSGLGPPRRGPRLAPNGMRDR
jgi:3-methyladenine DNA glycosylase/8-oxoguanine DNA glycosylase